MRNQVSGTLCDRSNPNNPPGLTGDFRSKVRFPQRHDWTPRLLEMHNEFGGLANQENLRK